MFDSSVSLIQQLKLENCSQRDIYLGVKRDDLIDDLVSGNKWRKLKYNILAVKAQKKERVITFGGAYSNHLVATAKACFIHGLESVGIVRGDELSVNSNVTLKACHGFGMKLVFVSREEYIFREDNLYLEQLHLEFPNAFIIPEGGANFNGLVGCQEIWQEIHEDFSDVAVAAGTGTTAAGLLAGMPSGMRLHVFSALKGEGMREQILKKIDLGFHNPEFTAQCAEKLYVYSEDYFGGYGKYNAELLEFMKWAKNQLDLPLDQVYTAKAFFRLYNLIQKEYFPRGARILFLHTGGLQGNTALTL